MRAALVFGVLLALVGSAFAQQNSDQPPELRSRFAEVTLSGLTAVPPSSRVNEALEQAEVAALRYELFSYEHRRDTFGRQGWMTVVVFVTVLLLVVSGLVLSALQFWAGMRHDEKALARAATKLDHRERVAGGDAPAVTNIELSLRGGVKVSSPVLGVAILALSMGFFYLYLNYVYPISYIASPVTHQVVTPGATD